MQDTHDDQEVIERRIKAISERAHALRAAGWYTTADLRWLAGYVRLEGVSLAEVEATLYDAERQAEHVVRVAPKKAQWTGRRA